MSDAGAAAAGPGLKGEITVVEADRFERAIARQSAECRATIPSMEFSAVVDAEALLTYEAELGCGITAIVVASVAKTLRALPRVNASYRDGHYELYSRVNVGVTMVGPGLFVTPTVFDADQKPVAEIARELADYYVRAREDELHPAELTGATFKLVDSSAYDILALAPMIHPSHAGAISLGPIRDVPVVRDGKVVPGKTLALALAVDHRIVYGHHAASFLEEVKANLEGLPA